MKNKDKSDSLTIRIEVENPNDIKKIVLNGIYHENYHYRVTEWENKVIVCYKCQRFNHLAKDCNNDTVCGKCTKNHLTKDCETEKNSYACIRCNSNDHPTWSKNCPQLMKKKMFINPRWAEIVAGKKNSNNQRYEMNKDNNESLEKIKYLEKKLESTKNEVEN